MYSHHRFSFLEAGMAGCYTQSVSELGSVDISQLRPVIPAEAGIQKSWPEIVARNRGMTGVLLIFTPTLTLPPTTIRKGEEICEIVSTMTKTATFKTATFRA